MPLTDRITFVVPVLDRKVLTDNFLASPCFQGPHPHQVIVQQHFRAASLAYNDGLRRAENELVIFSHSDMFFPENWINQLGRALQRLEQTDPNWGVLGCFGATREGEYRGHIYSSGWGIIGRPFEDPEPVQTLDEIVLIVRKNAGLRFDTELPGFHFYGTDICMRAAARGMRSYAIPAFCVHNTVQLLRLPRDFYKSYTYIRRTWKRALPIHTSCIRVSRFSVEMYRRRIKEAIRSLAGWDGVPVGRARDPFRIWKELQGELGANG
ncbi:MAG: hypothetical protein ACM336_03120 [Acidobacteriota bacterium]